MLVLTKEPHKFARTHILLLEHVLQEEVIFKKSLPLDNSEFKSALVLGSDCESFIGKNYTVARIEPKLINGVYLFGAATPSDIISAPVKFEQFKRDCLRARDIIFCKDIPNIIHVESYEQLKDILGGVSNGVFTFDLETDGFYWFERPHKPRDFIIMMAFSFNTDTVYILDASFFYTKSQLEYYKNINNPSFVHLLKKDIPLTKSIETILLLNSFFQREEIKFVAHNGKFDVNYLRSVGIEYARITDDTMLQHHVIDESPPHDLKSLGNLWLGYNEYETGLDKYLNKSRNKPYSMVPWDVLCEYAGLDVIVTRKLFDKYLEIITKDSDLDYVYSNISIPLSDVLADVERRGVKIDVERLHYWHNVAIEHLIKIEDKLNKLLREYIKGDARLLMSTKKYASTVLSVAAGSKRFNPNSHSQVAWVFYEVIRVPRIKHWRLKSQNPTNKIYLELLKIEDASWADHPFIKLIEKHRRLSKIISSYFATMVENVDIDDRLHCSFLIHGTEVGRLSARNPALQTIPRPDDFWGNVTRSLFIANGVFADYDYSQNELRSFGVLSMDPFYIQVYNDDRDLHSEVALSVYGDNYTKSNRTNAKRYNFSEVYGGGPEAMVLTSDFTFEDAKRLAEEKAKLTPVANQWKIDVFEEVKRTGFVKTVFKRMRRFPLITSSNEDDVRKQSVHFLVASTASEFNNLSMIELHKRGYNIVLAVHDNIITELEKKDDYTKECNEIESVMRTVPEVNLPNIKWKVDGGITYSWATIPKLISRDEMVKIGNEKLEQPYEYEGFNYWLELSEDLNV